MLSWLSDRLLACVGLAFILGLVLAANGAEGVSLAAAILLLLISLVTNRRVWIGAVLLSLSALAGAGLFLAFQLPAAGTAGALPQGGQTLLGTVASAPAYEDGWWRFLFDVEAHEQGGVLQPTGGRCYVRLQSRERVTRGQRWRLTGRLRPPSGVRNPGGKSEALRLSPAGAEAVMTVPGVLCARLGDGDLGWLSRHAFRAQQAALSALEAHVGEPYPELTAAVAGSVVFGVHAAPPPEEVADDFRRAGTMHLLVVSGSMVSLVFGMVFFPGAFAGKTERWWLRRRGDTTDQPGSGRGQIRRGPGVTAAVVAALVVTYYAFLTEGGQAVWRAAIMGLLVSLAFVLRRVPRVARQHGLTTDRYTLLAAAALVILTLQPSALFTPGFQLTFTAVLGLLYLTPAIEPWLGAAPRYVIGPVLGTLAAQLALFPVMVWHFGNAPFAGLAANIIAVPLASVIVVAGLLTVVLHPVLPALAAVPGEITGWATRNLIWTSGAFASYDWAAPEVGRPAVWAVVTWYAGLAAVGWLLLRLRLRRT